MVLEAVPSKYVKMKLGLHTITKLVLINQASYTKTSLTR